MSGKNDDREGFQKLYLLRLWSISTFIYRVFNYITHQVASSRLKAQSSFLSKLQSISSRVQLNRSTS